MALHPEASGHGGRGACIIGLHGAGYQDRIGLVAHGRTKIIFQLPHLVAAETETGAIVAFDMQVQTECFTEI